MTDDQPAGGALCSDDVRAMLHRRRLHLSWSGPDRLHHADTAPWWEAVATRRLGKLSPGLGSLRARWRPGPIDKTGLTEANGRRSRTWIPAGGQTEIRRGRAKKAFEVKALVGARLRVLDHRDILVSAGVVDSVCWHRTEKVPSRKASDPVVSLADPAPAGRLHHGNRRLSVTKTRRPRSRMSRSRCPLARRPSHRHITRRARFTC